MKIKIRTIITFSLIAILMAAIEILDYLSTRKNYYPKENDSFPLILITIGEKLLL